ncbi:MAG TPA: tRNA-dihydrouridine synthase family protein [Candidatus Paceibacterota bacterium]|nr:tRNA-dihydrouridine synthase family protein [Candidatus Paceibacterota bacterium]
MAKDADPKNFWASLPRPIMTLAPMANVTDAAFRRMFAECGKPDLLWTEFVSVEGLLSRGRDRLLPDLWFTPGEHPIVAQIFGGKPEQFEEIGPFVKKLGFDGIDINMGCPDRGVERSGAGAGLIKDPARAREIVRATKRGAGGLPVSVKTRLGYRDIAEMDGWLAALLEEKPAALTVHLRTRNEMSDVPAHWEVAAKIVELRNRISPDTVVLGNGDVESVADGRQKAEAAGMDGVMIGTGAFGNPWFFSGRVPDVRERLTRLATHTELFQELYRSNDLRPVSQGGRIKNFEVMKKHYKSYTSGSPAGLTSFDGARELRLKLMEATDAAEVREIVENFVK